MISKIPLNAYTDALALICRENMKIHDFSENLVNSIGGTEIQYTKHPEFDFGLNDDSVGI